MIRVTIAQAEADFSALLKRAAAKKQQIVVERGGKAVAAVVSIKDLRKLEQIAPKPKKKKLGAKKAMDEGSNRPAPGRKGRRGWSKLTLEEKIDRLSAEIPAEELEKLPTDLSERHDHYIYGRDGE